VYYWRVKNKIRVLFALAICVCTLGAIGFRVATVMTEALNLEGDVFEDEV
jgi:hypothetical protein